MHKLMNLLEKNIESNKKKLDKDIKIFKKSKDNYWNRSYGKELVVILNKTNSKSYKNIGFPFPLISEESKINHPKGISIMFFLTGEPVLKFQREQLINDLKKIKAVELIEILDLKEFQNLSKNIFKKQKSFDYYDPYSFIGDSFIGLHFPETIELNYNCKLCKVYSENHIPLSCCVDSEGYIGISNINNKINVFADLIANQWNRTKYLVRKKVENKEISLILGRDLIIVPTKKSIKIFHFKREGVLLRDENIEDYMNRCLSPFIMKLKGTDRKEIQITSENLIINPFGSCEAKTIPLEYVYELIKNYKKSNKKSKILVITGFKHNYSHLLWVAQLRLFIIRKGLEKEVILKDYGSFSEIKKDIQRYKIQIGITSDTSIAHFFNNLNLLNLTLFNINRVDLSSPQSLASDSPLGFCRYFSHQIPVLFSEKRDKKIVEGILESIEYFRDEKRSKDWTKKLFDSHILINKISPENKNLIEANKKINPLNKIK